MTWKLSTLPRWHHVGIIVFCRNEYEYMILLVLATHQIIFRFLSRGDQQLPNGFHKHLKMRRKFLVVFLGVQTHIITNLGLDLLQQTSFGFVLYLKLLQSSQNHQKNHWNPFISRIEKFRWQELSVRTYTRQTGPSREQEGKAGILSWSP